MKQDIKNKTDIKLLVTTFYNNVLANNDLKNKFAPHLSEHWDEHIERLSSFWQTIVLKEMTYQGKPDKIHFSMNLDAKDFDHWYNVWSGTVDTLFEGPNAEKAKHRGKTMAQDFLKKINKAKHC